jgi:hypothetical protein
MSSINFDRFLKLEDYNHDQLIDLLVAFQTVCTVAYFISSIILIDNSYAGFNGVLLALIFGASIGLSYKGLRKTPDRILYGVILGVVFVLLFVSLQSAIFWGQYSGCEEYMSTTKRLLVDSTRRMLSGVDCSHTMAMSSMSVFSVFLFLSYMAQLGVMIKYKHDILGAPSGPVRSGYAPVSVSRATGPTLRPAPVANVG